MKKENSARTRLKSYALDHPEIITMKKLAALMSITYQRVQQINATEHLSNIRQREDLLCRDCQRLMRQGQFQKETRCEDCQQIYTTNRKESRKKYLNCATCGKVFFLPVHTYLRRLKNKKRVGNTDFYCCRSCWGVFVGKHYGNGGR
jgi:uncharacterized paraquat-inducible protein A